MPNSPKKINRAYKPDVKPFARAVSNSSFYNSTAWRKLRNRFIRNNPVCVHCEQQGVVTPASVADHITPITQGGEPLCESNLQPLCATCHNKKSAAESRASKGGMG